jgi:DNA-binding transcriptional ArsR family regulator
MAWIYLHPDRQWSVTALAGLLRRSQSTVSREADRLVAAGLVHEERQGNMRLLQANLDTPLARSLTEMLTLTYGPAAVLGELLSSVDGVEEAYIYGSWAARYSGESGPAPRDVDVLVIGGADDDDVFEVARQAEQKLGREVNIRLVTAKAWRAWTKDPFLAQVRNRPVFSIDVQGERS